MDCKRCRVEIEEAGRDALPGVGMAAHLAACADCRKFRAERVSLSGLIGGLARVDAPNDFEFRLRARLAAEGMSRARGGWQTYFPRAAWAAAAGCLLLAVGVSLRSGQTTTPAVAEIGSQNLPLAAQGAGSELTSERAQAASVVTEATPSDEGVEVAEAGDEGGGKSVISNQPADRRRRRQTIVPKAVLAEIATRVGETERFDEHSRSVIGATVIPLPVSAGERPLQVTFKDMQGASRVVKVDPVAFGTRESNLSGARVVNAAHKQGVW